MNKQNFDNELEEFIGICKSEYSQEKIKQYVQVKVDIDNMLRLREQVEIDHRMQQQEIKNQFKCDHEDLSNQHELKMIGLLGGLKVVNVSLDASRKIILEQMKGLMHISKIPERHTDWMRFF